MDSLRELRKEQLLQIACRVQAEYHFREACKERIPRRDDYYLSSGSVVEEYVSVAVVCLFVCCP